MKDMTGKFVVSTNEENFHGSEFYDTLEEAMKEGSEELGLEDDEGFYIGQVKHIDLDKMIDNALDRMMEQLEEDIYELVGDFSHNWPNQKKVGENWPSLLTSVQEWFKKHSPIDFWQVENVEYFNPKTKELK